MVPVLGWTIAEVASIGGLLRHLAEDVFSVLRAEVQVVHGHATG